MTPQEFIAILMQNPKVTNRFLDAAMREFGWNRLPDAAVLSFTDGTNTYSASVVVSC